MSRVFLAVTPPDSGLPKLVVAKVLLPELAREADFVSMFFDEARISIRLDHPNVVRLYEVVEDGETPCILLEFLDGASVESLSRRARSSGGIPVDISLFIIAQAAWGLHYAHELQDERGAPLGIVHRDVSPQNVFVTFDGAVKVLDFGIAKATDSSHATKTGVVKGKFAYMAPEQIKDAKRIDRRADIFALGVMTWQAVAKRRLWAGLSELQIVEKLVAGAIPPPSTPDAPVDPACVAIIERATAPERDARYATAAELAEDIERFLATLPVPCDARRVGEWVQNLMADRRAKVAAVVEAALAPPSGPPQSGASSLAAFTPTPLSVSIVSEGATGQSVTGAPSMATSSSAPSSSGGGTAQTRMRAPPVEEREAASATAVDRGRITDRIVQLALGLGSLALLTAIIVIVARTSDASSGAVAPPPPTAAAPREEFIELSLSARPLDARIYVDGALLATNPVKARFRRDGAVHLVRVEAGGYRPVSQRVVYDESVKVVSIVLAKDR